MKTHLEHNRHDDDNHSSEEILIHRLSNLVRIDNNVEIDSGYITIEEYQLFIDEESKFNRSRQPDHWKTATSVGKDLTQPVTGIRLQDAEAFCEWLSHNQFLSKTKELIRLPNKQEVFRQPIVSDQIGYWYSFQNRKYIGGISPSRLEGLEVQLTDIIFNELDSDLRRDYDLPLHLGDKDQPRDASLELIRNRNTATSHITRLRDRRPKLESFPNVDLDNLRKGAKELELFLRQVSRFIPDILIYKNLAHDLDIAFQYAEDFELLRSYLLCIHIIWDITGDFLNRKVFNKSDHVFSKCGAEINESYQLYALVVLIDSRRRNLMPSWEGIRIVKESRL